MPNCFQLFPKGSTEAEVLQVVDKKMCEHFKVPEDPNHWHHCWYDTIGFAIATSHTFETFRERINANLANPELDHEFSTHLLEVLNWMDDNYTTDAWAEIGRGK